MFGNYRTKLVLTVTAVYVIYIFAVIYMFGLIFGLINGSTLLLTIGYIIFLCIIYFDVIIKYTIGSIFPGFGDIFSDIGNIFAPLGKISTPLDKISLPGDNKALQDIGKMF